MEPSPRLILPYYAAWESTLGNLAYRVPDVMQVGKAEVIKLLVSPTAALAQLKDKLAEQPGQVEGEPVPVAELMEAKLFGTNFEIIEEFASEPLLLLHGKPTAWVWTIHPRREGTQRLHLSLSAVVEVRGKVQRSSMDVFDRWIEVRVEPRHNSAWWLPGLALVTLAGTSLGWLWRKKHSRSPASTLPTTAAPPLFISYSRRDAKHVKRIVHALQARGASVWMDITSMEGATPWSKEIVLAIQRAQAVVLVASAHSFASNNVVREISLALEENKCLLPVFLESIEIPADLRYQLAGLHRLNWQGDAEATADEIIRAMAALEIGHPA